MIARSTSEQEQRAQRQQICIDRPLEIGSARRKTAPDGRQGNVHHRTIDEGQARCADRRGQCPAGCRAPLSLARDALPFSHGPGKVAVIGPCQMDDRRWPSRSASKALVQCWPRCCLLHFLIRHLPSRLARKHRRVGSAFVGICAADLGNGRSGTEFVFWKDRISQRPSAFCRS